MLPPLNFRLRMMLLFCFVIGALMAITCATVYSIFVKTIRAELDQDLVHAARPMMADLYADPQKDDLSELNLREQMLLVFDQNRHLLSKTKNGHPFVVHRIAVLPNSPALTFRTLDTPQSRCRAALIPFE